MSQPLGSPPAPILTARLKLIPSTAELARASRTSHEALESRLGTCVTDEWPPEVLADVEEMFARGLEAAPHMAGWFGWYIVATDRALTPRDTLVGSIGAMHPDERGVCMWGYSVLPAFERRGIGSEAAVAFVGWLADQPALRLLRADSFTGNTVSIRILERCAMTCVGPSPDDAAAPDSDRKGRGVLLRFERRLRPEP
jgi:RimJ/RimL family protein N-acetyltransferase